ncbi:MAG: 7,8-didemethyl-8-hydroxy-5-deazariboflavin synthase, partial [bacterium]
AVIHAEHGHIQEVIIQNFRAKPGTKLAGAEEPDLDDLLWTIAAARIVIGGAMNLQAPPNLSPGVYQKLVAAGLNDWGGVSPVTPDHVNPEAPWPTLHALRERTEAAGAKLRERLPVYPDAVARRPELFDPQVRAALHRLADESGFARPRDGARQEAA